MRLHKSFKLRRNNYPFHPSRNADDTECKRPNADAVSPKQLRDKTTIIDRAHARSAVGSTGYGHARSIAQTNACFGWIAVETCPEQRCQAPATKLCQKALQQALIKQPKASPAGLIVTTFFSPRRNDNADLTFSALCLLVH